MVPYVPVVPMVPLSWGTFVPKVPVSPLLSPRVPMVPLPCSALVRLSPHLHSPHMSPPRGPLSPGCRCPPTCVCPRPQEGLARCQREAEEVTELMKQNFARALERDGRLSDLDSRAQELRAMGETFTRSTRAVARQQRRGHRRWRLVVIGLAGLFLLLLLLLILGLALWLPRPPPAIITVPPGTPPSGE
ncbi:vesicle-associated membrane protein 2-like isoform X2 [Accipiter gentilis]|uniref:vesicle-associated membrane protein 2-like isoform X2 n=1 Tax=Astur gentilis TaxID=8957 RepID=UPI0021107473|nr:vesicle-associated membrane protein 2-like isoform X2 [Accipiter gentilis]XP_049687078.1 vesicle-associated membrane protein 2-like isoform X2 [Accipiter gentilis]